MTQCNYFPDVKISCCFSSISPQSIIRYRVYWDTVYTFFFIIYYCFEGKVLIWLYAEYKCQKKKKMWKTNKQHSRFQTTFSVSPATSGIHSNVVRQIQTVALHYNTFDFPLFFNRLLCNSYSICASPCPLLSLALPKAPTTPPTQLYSFSTPFFTWDHRLKPGRITVTWCPCVWCFAGTPLHSGNALCLFPTPGFHCG